MKRIIFTLIALCAIYPIHAVNKKSEPVIPQKAITVAKLAASSYLFYLSSLCVYNAYKVNKNHLSSTEFLYWFYNGWVSIKALMANPHGPSATISFPHLPLMAASGGIMALSGVYIKDKLHELWTPNATKEPNDQSKAL